MNFNHPNILKWKYYCATKDRTWEENCVLIVAGRSGGYIFRNDGLPYYERVDAYYCPQHCYHYKSVSFEDGIKLFTKEGVINFCKFLNIPLTPAKKISEFPEKDILGVYALLNQKKAFCADSALDMSKYKELSELVDALFIENKIKESKVSPNHYFLVGNTLTETGK